VWWSALAESKVLRDTENTSSAAGSLAASLAWLEADHRSDNVHCTPCVHHPRRYLWISSVLDIVYQVLVSPTSYNASVIL
jgi:hypothetical protein